MKKHRVDYGIVTAMTILLLIGIVMVYSASYPYAIAEYNDGLHVFKKHVIYLILGIISTIATYIIPLRFWKKSSFFILLITMGLCLLTFTSYGVEIYGARRWVYFSFLRSTIQPSDFLKFGICLYIPSLLSNRREQTVIPFVFFGILALALGIVYKQRDLSTTMVIGIIMFMLYFVTYMHLWEIPIYGLAAFVGLKVSLTGYRMLRIKAWKDPEAYALQKGWGILQTLYAVANGGVFGVGIGNSIQKYSYIFAAHSDYIFSILSEELGLIGVFFTFSCILFMTIRLMIQSMKLDDDFGSLVLFAVASLIGVQSLIHIGVGANAIPATGIPLPFISYGGSSMIAFMAMMGLVFNVLASCKRKELKE
ncbi:MAG: putative peptidoglycan glycosyltransferase FtsW [Tissierellia bacterium]|nr:putative peptidoglycan glycosyltransferase FtsW [Tissierellia bacterium]